MSDNNNGAPAQPAPGNDGAQPPPPQNDGGPAPEIPGGPAQQPEAPAPPEEAPPPPLPAPAPQPNSKWCANPMAGNFDPGTPHGREIFKNKTRGLPDDQRFALTTKDAPEIRKFLMGRQGALGKIVTKVPALVSPGGVVLQHANLITQYQLLTFERLQREAHARYATPLREDQAIPAAPWQMRPLDPENNLNDRDTFYSQVNSNVLHQLLVNCLTPSAYTKAVQGRLNLISFEDPDTGALVVDGPCLLFLIFEKVDPSLAVNVENLRERIESVKLHTFQNNVDELLMFIEENYEKILNMNKSCESILRYTLTALLSGSCQEFNSYIKSIKGDVDSGFGQHANITFEQLVVCARKKYLNMRAQNEYNKVDPRSAQLIALTTEVTKLKGDLEKKSAALTTTTDRQRTSTRRETTPGLDRNLIENTNIQKWRVVKKGDSIEVDGRTLWWCEKHKDYHNRWNGMYVPHKPEDHDRIMAERKSKRNRRNPPATTPSDDKTETPGDKLVVSQKLKEVLCSRLMVG